MPLIRETERKREVNPVPDEEQAGPGAKQPRLEPDETGTPSPETGRPYEDFVVSTVRKYWQDMSADHNLIKPTREEIRTAAMPILVQGLRRRTGSKKYVDPVLARRAVNDMVQHAREQGWIRAPVSALYGRLTNVGALIQMARDAGWLASEIPFPAHPDPQHPPMYYTIDLETNQPVPKAGSHMLSEYVRSPLFRHRVCDEDRIYPYRIEDETLFANISEMLQQDRNACFTLAHVDGNIEVFVCWIVKINQQFFCIGRYLKNMYFSPRRNEQ